MIFKSTNRKAKRGFTLTELAIVLGVMGVITGAIWVAASNTSEVNKDNAAVTELQTIVQNMNDTMVGRSLSQCNGSNTVTSCLIQAQIIPSTYVTPSTGTTADNPWSSGNLIVYRTAAGFRVRFANTTLKGCINLLLQGTNCQPNQIGCPTIVYTNTLSTTDRCIPNQSNCPSGSPTTTAGLGWQSMTPSAASTMCKDNPTNGGTVDFDYTL